MPKKEVDPEMLKNLDEMALQPRAKKDLKYFLENYQGEAVCCGFLFFCFIYLFVGKLRNEKIANKWHQVSLPVIRENFAYVGMEDGVDKVDME